MEDALKAMLGRKLGMTQVFKNDNLIPVTMLEAGPCVVTKIEPREKGVSYQIGYGDVKPQKVNKPKKGYFNKIKVDYKKHLIEFVSEESFEIGQSFTCDIFAEGDKANVTAVSKGKGFQGVVKRWGFAGGPGGHGSHFHRAPGSVGMAATPSRVLKGRKLPGQMGSKQITVKNLEVIDIDYKNNRIYLKGAVPGGKGTLVLIKSEDKIAEPRIEEVEEVKKVEKVEEEKTQPETKEAKTEVVEEIKEEVKEEEKTEEQKEEKEEKKAEVVEEAEEKAEVKEETENSKQSEVNSQPEEKTEEKAEDKKEEAQAEEKKEEKESQQQEDKE